VVNLARGHPVALDTLVTQHANFVVNLGMDQGYSMLDVVRSLEKASGRPVPCEIVTRRPGDVASCYANPVAAARLPGWQAKFVSNACVWTTGAGRKRIRTGLPERPRKSS